MKAILKDLNRNNSYRFYLMYKNIINDLRRENDNVSISRPIAAFDLDTYTQLIKATNKSADNPKIFFFIIYDNLVR